MINRTTQFMFPLLLSDKYIEYFNLYLGINTLDDIDGKIYCVEKLPITDTIINAIKSLNIYAGFTILDDKKIFILSVPDKYNDDYLQFLIGNFKEIKLETKYDIYNFWYNKALNDEKYTVISNAVLYTLFNDWKTKEDIAQYLAQNDREYKEILKALKKHNETESIPKLSNEIFKTKDI